MFFFSTVFIYERFKNEYAARAKATLLVSFYVAIYSINDSIESKNLRTFENKI
jgi:hypothetical protein